MYREYKVNTCRFLSLFLTVLTHVFPRAVVRNSPEIVRSSLLPFFTFAADDLTQTVANLKTGRFSHVKGTITRGATSLNYVHMVLLPVLSSMFDHLGSNGFGRHLLGEWFWYFYIFLYFLLRLLQVTPDLPEVQKY